MSRLDEVRVHREVDRRILASEAAHAAEAARRPAPAPDAPAVHCLRPECHAVIAPEMRSRPQMFGVLQARVDDEIGWFCGQQCRTMYDWRARSSGQPVSVLLDGPKEPAPPAPPMRIAVATPGAAPVPAMAPIGSTRRVTARCAKRDCDQVSHIDQVVRPDSFWSPDAAALLRVGGWSADPVTGETYCSVTCMTWVQALRAQDAREAGTRPRDVPAVTAVDDLSYRQGRARARALEGLPVDDETTPAAPPDLSVARAPAPVATAPVPAAAAAAAPSPAQPAAPTAASTTKPARRAR